MELLEYDGYSEILVRSIEDAAAFFSGPEYAQSMNSMLASSHCSKYVLKSISPWIDDEGNWLARPVRFMVGYDNLIFGQAISLPGTTDGILPSDMQS